MAIDLVEKTVRKSKGMHQIGFFSACGGLPYTHVTTNLSEILITHENIHMNLYYFSVRLKVKLIPQVWSSRKITENQYFPPKQSFFLQISLSFFHVQFFLEAQFF